MFLSIICYSLIQSEMHDCPPFNGYAADEEEDLDPYPKDDVQKYPYRVSKERRNAVFEKKGKSDCVMSHCFWKFDF